MNPTTPTAACLYSPLAQDPDLNELVDMFVAEMPERTSSLLAQVQARDWEQLRCSAHRLRGAAGSYGFGQLTPSAARLEEAISTRAPEEQILQAVDELVELCGRIRCGTP